MHRNQTVYVVEHMHQLGGREESVKLIGVYSKRDYAEEAVERLKLQPGFRDSAEGFTIDPYTLDKDNWAEGYITLRQKSKKDERNE